jgi:hypothetical protein
MAFREINPSTFDGPSELGQKRIEPRSVLLWEKWPDATQFDLVIPTERKIIGECRGTVERRMSEDRDW